MAQAAKDKTEEVLQVLQKKAREFLAAEEGLVEAARELLEDKKWNTQEIKKRLEEGFGRLKAHTLWERLRQLDSVVVLGDYKDGFEKRVEDTVHAILNSLQIANKGELAALSREVSVLRDRLEKLTPRNHSDKAKKKRNTM
jgi:hypothetical protein